MKARATLEAREDVTDRNFETRRQMTARVSHCTIGKSLQPSLFSTCELPTRSVNHIQVQPSLCLVQQ